jgi:hypothetical protein
VMADVSLKPELRGAADATVARYGKIHIQPKRCLGISGTTAPALFGAPLATSIRLTRFLDTRLASSPRQGGLASSGRGDARQ